MHRKRNGRSKRGGHAAPYGGCRLFSEFLLAAKVTCITLFPEPNARGRGGERNCGAADRTALIMFYGARAAATQAAAMELRASGQSKASPGSVLRPGAMSLCPARRVGRRAG